MMIDKLHAVASDAAPTYIPVKNFSSPPVLLETLAKLGFQVPAALSKLAASGAPLNTAGFKISVYELDCSLKNTSLTTQARLALKTGLGRAGILVEDRR
jgi:hypothetical protein